MEKSPLTAGGLPPNMPARAMTLAKWDEHARQRKAWSYPFSNTALMGQEPLIQMHVAKFIRELQKLAATGKAVNIGDWLTFCTFDVIGELCFAEPFGCLDSGGATEWSMSVYNIAIAGTLDQATRRVAGVNTWLQRTMARWLIPVKYRHWREAHFRKSRETTARRLADKDRDHKDFVYYVLRNGTEAPLVSELELAMNTALFIGAGSETSAFAMTAWVNLMLRNPGPYEKLVKEIRGTIRSAADISWATVKELAYLEAVVNETLRLGMPAPSNLNRTVPDGGAYIDGNWVPGGTTVSVSTWAATHLAQNFEDPLSFIPERFLKSEEHRFARDNKLAWQPFSYGPRGCIGKNLAYIEMRLIICQLLFHFDLEAPGGREEVLNEQWTLEGDMKNMKSWLVWEKPALWIRLKEVAA
ncbi:cytochrome P450 [Podospora appendiculata]|uniref:Cytochrome P450 n=1 Tax=Podospora appendiculata TaxID=314037 RepID=A0AAE1CG08_9PEZI|nr:cytochrome P450 [Podospora appendiculata]